MALGRRLQATVASLLVINAVVSSFEAARVSFAGFDGAVILCLAVDFSLVAVEVGFVGEGAVMACWIFTPKAFSLFGACDVSIVVFS